MKHKSFKEFLLESRLREFRGWWKIGESEPRKIWFSTNSDDEDFYLEHSKAILKISSKVKKKFSDDGTMTDIINYALSHGWIRFGQVRDSVHGKHTFIHFDRNYGTKVYRTILKIINWLDLSRDDKIALSGNPSELRYNTELEKVLTVQRALYFINKEMKK